MEIKNGQERFESDFDLFMLALLTVLWAIPTTSSSNPDVSEVAMLPAPTVTAYGPYVELDFGEFGVRQLMLQ
jgi:hypothetical protein